MRNRSLPAAAVAACALAGAVVPATAAPSDPALDRLDRRLDALVDRADGPPGAIAIVQRGSRVHVVSAGVRRVGSSAPPRANDAMRTASVSKAFSGAAALALVRQGRLALDDTIGERLPGLPAAWRAVTLRQLLQHTSGVPDFIATSEGQRAVAASPRRAPAPERLLSFVEDEPLRFTPGTRYGYSNSDNIVVGLMVAAVTGRSYPAALRSTVLGPLGLAATKLPRGVGLRRPFVSGYAPDPPGRPEDVTFDLAGGWAWASGGVVSTPRNLNRFIRAYVRGSLTTPAARSSQRRFRTGAASEPPGPGANAAGLALFRYRTRCGTVFGHTGNTFGYTQFAAASPNGRRSVTVSVNSQISRRSPELLRVLRRAQAEAACAALS
ncbi:MAG: serine hydrolase domain-containing protein [Miltoncostaeaceae bacterium]